MDENGVSSSVDTGGSSDSGHSSVDTAPSTPSAPPSEAVSGPSDSSAGSDTSGAGGGVPAVSGGGSVAGSEGSDTSGSNSDLVGAIGDLVDALQGGVTDTGETADDAAIVDGEGDELPVRDAEWFAELYGEYVGSQEDTGLQLESIETYALSPIESSTGLKGILLEIIGPYDNVVTQYRYQSSTTSSNYTYVNEVTPDYPWIASAALFIALVISVFGLLRKALWTL